MRGLLAVVIAALTLAVINAKLAPDTTSRGTVAALLTEHDPPAGFATALRPRAFEFPADHGAHPRFRSEWWYFTGNTTSRDEHAFGFQLTIFRFALQPAPLASRSQWRQSDVYLAHFAISDISEGTFYSFERRARPALELAGARAAPTRIWLRDWSIAQIDPEHETWHLAAREAGIGLDLVLSAEREVTPQGEYGLSQKSAEPGNASYYYSIPRFDAAGTIEVSGSEHEVRGSAWFDHEWSTSALADDQVGWDWFSLQLDDGSDLMFYQIRDTAGRSDPVSHGIALSPAGARTELAAGNVQVKVLRHWRSAASGARYPAEWQIVVPTLDLTLHIAPRLQDQEWRKSFTYWEGAVAVTGVSRGAAIAGLGYVELVGYD